MWEMTGDTQYWHRKNAQGQSAQHFFANIGLGDDACDPSNTAHVPAGRKFEHRRLRKLLTLAQNADTSAREHQNTAEFNQKLQWLSRKERTEKEHKLRESLNLAACSSME